VLKDKSKQSKLLKDVSSYKEYVELNRKEEEKNAPEKKDKKKDSTKEKGFEDEKEICTVGNKRILNLSIKQL